MGAISEDPVTLVPGLSLLLTSLAISKSVTAVATIGILFVALAIVWAAGVAMAPIKSTLLPVKRVAILRRLDWSAWAFWKSNLTFLPSTKPLDARPSTKPLLAASSAWCSTSWTTPMLYVLAAEAWAAGVAVFLSSQPVTVRTAARDAARRQRREIFIFVLLLCKFLWKNDKSYSI